VKFGRTPKEIENERKRLLIYAFVGLGSLFLGTFGTISVIEGRFLLGSIILFFFGVVFTAALITKKMSEVQPVSLFLALILLFLAWYLILSGGAEGTGVYWTYPMSMLMVLLVGPKVGIIYMGLYLFVNSIFLFGPFTFPYDYSDIEAIRIIATSIALYVLILASEWIRVGSYGAISEASENHRNRANTDPLTGLLNRRGIQLALQDKEGNQSAIVTVLDIDKFKLINDNFGHYLGDLVLVRLAKLLTDNTKGVDLIARWGGEEFLLIFFATNLNPAKTLVNKIKDDFESIRFSCGKTDVSATFSAGMAIFDDISSFELSVKQADQKLYEAKNSGRNKVVSQTLPAQAECRA
jgi:diguanylate cyclase (GGDEF)-like protein